MIRIAIAALFLCAALAPITASAEEPAQRVILVLDASGSMWGQIDGRAKIEIAREVVGDLLEEWDPAVHVGLATYGHRRKGDCDDIELLVEPGAVDAAAIEKAVADINPKGKTPLSAAVIQAAEELRYTEEKATIILVSDGRETCEADPCLIGSQLEENGVDFTTHVIGFDVAEKADREQLRCLAENTGGEFHAAKDASSLNEALARTAQVVHAAPASKPPPLVPATDVIEAGCSFTGAAIGGDVGSTHVVACPADCGGPLWGTDTYTADSSICHAGRHAGLIGDDGGLVGVILAAGRPAYRGTLRNGIHSKDYGAYGASFTIAATNAKLPAAPAPPVVPADAPPIEAGCSFTGSQIQGEIGSVHRVNCPASCTGSIWGTTVYTGDSRVCAAAIHAGAVSEQGGDVAVAIEGARPAFRGSERNGVRSSDYGSYGGSFRIGPAASAPAARAPR